MQRLGAVFVVLVLVVGAAAGCGDSSGDTATTDTQSVDTSGGSGSSDLPAYDPLSIIALRNDTFRSGEEYTISFAGRDGYEAILDVACEEAGEVDVAVPLYISPATGAFGSSPMTAHFNSEEFAFLVNDLPELGSAPGEGLAASLGRSLAASQSALYHLEAMAAVDDNDVDWEHTIGVITDQIASQQALLDDLTANGRLILTDGTSQITLSGDQLSQVDRILYAQYSSLLQGRVDSIDTQIANQAGSRIPLSPDWEGASQVVHANMRASGPSRGDSDDVQLADQAGYSNPLNPDWERVSQEVHAYLIANGPDRLRVVGAAMQTTHTGWTPLDLRLEEQGYAAAFAAAHSGVAMAVAAMEELTFSRGASDPDDCHKLTEGISNMETAIQLIDITSESAGAWPAHWFLDDGAAHRSWKEDNQAMLGTMRSWAAQHCPDLATGDPGAVTGTVTDAETGEPIPGATISLSAPGFETTTDPAGAFTLDAVPPGSHSVFASADGFAQTTSQVQVETDETAQVTITLESEIQFPRTYAGTGTQTAWTDYLQGSCVTEGQTLSVTLLPDGIVAATWTSSAGTYTTDSVDGVGILVCLDPGDPVTTILDGRHESGHVVIYGPEGPSRVVGEGDYTAQGLVIKRLFQTDFENGTHSYIEVNFELAYQGG